MTDARQQRHDARDVARAIAEGCVLEDTAKTRAAEKLERLQEIMWTYLLRRPVNTAHPVIAHPSDVIGYLDTPLEPLLSSVGITHDGFQRRGRDSVVDTALFDSIRTNGFNQRCTIFVCEIPWGPDEVAEVQQQELKEAQ